MKLPEIYKVVIYRKRIVVILKKGTMTEEEIRNRLEKLLIIGGAEYEGMRSVKGRMEVEGVVVFVECLVMTYRINKLARLRKTRGVDTEYEWSVER